MLPYFAILFDASEGCQTILVFKRESFIETNLQYIMQQAIPKLLPIYEHKAISWKGMLLFCLPSQNATIYQTVDFSDNKQGMGNGEPKRETYMIFTESFMFYL